MLQSTSLPSRLQRYPCTSSAGERLLEAVAKQTTRPIPKPEIARRRSRQDLAAGHAHALHHRGAAANGAHGITFTQVPTRGTDDWAAVMPLVSRGLMPVARRLDRKGSAAAGDWGWRYGPHSATRAAS